MANFNQSYERLKRWEGGYQSNPNDPGNYNSRGELVGTNYGINAAVFEDWIGRPPTKSEVQNMAASTAKSIYRLRFWDKIWGDQIPSQPVADILFDGVVNHGRGVRLAQEVLGVATDNSFGQNTFNALVSFPAREFYLQYKERRRRYYEALVQNDPSLGVFLNGWMKRINSFTDFSGEPSGGGGEVASFGGGMVWALIGLLLIGGQFFKK